MQQKQYDWTYEWSKLKDDSSFLFEEWIYPLKLEDFKGKRVLDAGCGPGHHSRMVAPYAKEVIGVDLNTAAIAKEYTKDLPNVTIIEGDLAEVKIDPPVDVAFCVGVINHTDDPDRTFNNLKRLVIKGGTLIIWGVSDKGNFLNQAVVEPLKRILLLKLPKGLLYFLAGVVTAFLYPFVWTIYFLPLKKILPFYEYFGNFRKLSFKRNFQNVFDRLNAPQTVFLPKEQVELWFNPNEFDNVHISSYKGISWRCSGTKK